MQLKTLVFIACVSNDSSDESAYLHILTRAFATPIQNISTFRRSTVVFIACASKESSDESTYLLLQFKA